MTDTADNYTETSEEFERRIVDMIQRQMNEVESDVLWVLTD